MDFVTPTATGKGPAERFVGDVYVDLIQRGEEPSRLVAARVSFTPGARTNWHSHPVGQILHVTHGVGLVGTRDGRVLVMRPGDTVHTPPGEEHWHGACATRAMTHLALLECDADGVDATWLESVDDDSYARANTELAS